MHYVPWQQTWQVINLSVTEQENWCGVVSCVIWKQKIEDSELTESDPVLNSIEQGICQAYSREAVLFSVTQEWLKSNLHYCSKCVLHLKCNLFRDAKLNFSSHYSVLSVTWSFRNDINMRIFCSNFFFLSVLKMLVLLFIFVFGETMIHFFKQF